MKIQFMSDIHLEFGPMTVPEVHGDVLVLAGDIHTGAKAIPFLNECADEFNHVIYLLGNHEYYGQKMWELPNKIRAVTECTENLHFLDNGSIIIDGINFIGSTLWSKADPMLQFIMNDFRKITCKYAFGYNKLSPERAFNLHIIAKKLIKNSIIPGEKNVVITHFAPSMEMIDTARYNDAKINTGYATDILQEFDPKDISLWISGHTHSCYDKEISGIHCVSNCRGYVGYKSVEEFDPNKIMEI
jgi:predicted phosphodiesterase